MNRRARLAFAITFTLAPLVACGGAEPQPEAPAAPMTPPSLPPSMAGSFGPGGGASSPQPATAPAAPVSDDVTRGMKAFEAGDTSGARASFEAALKKNPADADALYAMGLTDEKKGDRAAAAAHYRDALKQRPDHDAAAMNLSALLIDEQKYDDAVAVARAGLAKHGDNGALRMNLAVALASNGDSAAATRELDEAAKRAPKDPMVHMTYGHWLGVWKQKDGAVKELLAAKSLANDDRGVVAQVGEELRLVGAVPECIAAFGRAIELQDAAELRTGRALCKLAAKDDAGALADLQAAVTKEPKYALAHYYLGGRYAASAKWKECATEYETYLKLQPDGAFAKQAKERAKVAHEKASGKK